MPLVQLIARNSITRSKRFDLLAKRPLLSLESLVVIFSCTQLHQKFLYQRGQGRIPFCRGNPRATVRLIIQ